MILSNLLSAAGLSAAIVGPFALIMAIKMRHDQYTLKHWIVTDGIVKNVYHVSGEIDYDILEFSYSYLGKAYRASYDNKKYYPLSFGSKSAILVSPNRPSEINMVRPGDVRTAAAFMTFVYVTFFVVIFCHYTFGHSSL